MTNKNKINVLLGLAVMGGVLQACKAGESSLQHNVLVKSTPIVITHKPKISPNVNIDYLMGKFNPAHSKLFTKIPRQYADRSGLYLRKETLAAFKKMHAVAKREGIHLTIRSATRNFSAQKRIWERKWTGKKILSDGTNVARDIRKPVDKAYKILQYSSMPGTSRHHWGTDIDLNAFNNRWFETGKGLKIYLWLTQNADKFGFCQPYTADRPYGYQEEKWHWSYKPLSVPMLREASLILSDDKIKGFLGSETASQIGVVRKYILGVSNSCR